MRSRVAVAAVVVGALLVSSCAVDDSTPGAGPADSIDAAKTATIRVTQEQTACCYTEGQISFLRLSGGSDVVLDRGFAPAAMTAVLVEVAVEPGTYRLESWQRPCSASCPALDEQGQTIGQGSLDPGRHDECSIELTVTADEFTNVLVSFAPAEGCTISLPDTQPESEVPDQVALRQAYPTCGLDFGLEELAFIDKDLIGELSANELRRCFLDAYNDGQQAELEAYEPTAEPEILRRLIYRSHGDGRIEVFFHQAPEWEEWFRYTCTGLDPAAAGYEFDTIGCTSPEPLN